MIGFLIGFLVLVLVLYIVYWAISHFGLPAPAQTIVGLICVLILLVYVFNEFVGRPIFRSGSGWGSETTTIRVTDR